MSFILKTKRKTRFPPTMCPEAQKTLRNRTLNKNVNKSAHVSSTGAMRSLIQPPQIETTKTEMATAQKTKILFPDGLRSLPSSGRPSDDDDGLASVLALEEPEESLGRVEEALGTVLSVFQLPLQRHKHENVAHFRPSPAQNSLHREIPAQLDTNFP